MMSLTTTYGLKHLIIACVEWMLFRTLSDDQKGKVPQITSFTEAFSSDVLHFTYEALPNGQNYS